MDGLKLASFVLFVKDVSVSKKFYEEMLEQEVLMDISNINVGFKSGLALWEQKYATNTIFEKNISSNNEKHDHEIYFETSNLDQMYEKMINNKVNLLHPIKVQPWQQRVFRVYDPDNFIIEIAETMEEVIRRLHNDGMKIDTISEKTFMPKEVVESIIKVDLR